MLDRGNVNLKILDPTGLSEHVTGVVGNFIAPGSYHIERHSDDFGLLTHKNHKLPVRRQRHNRNKDCWTITKSDVEVIIPSL